MGKLEIELEVLKCKIQQEELLDDFKDKLENSMNNEYNKCNETKKKAIFYPLYCCYRAAAVFICFMVLSSCAFADELEGIFSLVFSNFDKNIEIAYEKGDIKEINTDYQNFNGISLNVNAISYHEDNLYLAFNVEAEEEFDKICFENFELKDENETVIFDSQLSYDNMEFNRMSKKTNKYTGVQLISISKNGMNIEKYNTLNILVSSIKIKNDDKIEDVNGDWNFVINLNEED